MNKDFDTEKELGFEELEDRLEMAQVASGDVVRCLLLLEEIINKAISN